MNNLFLELNKREEKSKTNKKLTLFEAYDMLEETLNNLWEEVNKKEDNPSHIIELELPPIYYLLEHKTDFSSTSAGFDEFNAFEMVEIQCRDYKAFLKINGQHFSYEEKMYFIEGFEAYADKVDLHTEHERQQIAQDFKDLCKEIDEENKFLEKYQGKYIPTR